MIIKKSNGIRFSISDLAPPKSRLLRCIYRERAAISLFDALGSSSSSSSPPGNVPLTFPPETIRLVAQTLARFCSIAVDDYGVPTENITVFATEAMRRAQNATAMLDAIREAAPVLRVQILTPEVETLFGSMGARSGFVDVKGLFLDLGGGSVQMTYMDTYAARREAAAGGGEAYEIAAAMAGESLPFGAARLIRVLETADTDVQVAEKSSLQQGMREAFEKLRRRFPGLTDISASASGKHTSSEGIDIYLCGGGFRGYGSMLMHNDPVQPYPVPLIGTYAVSGSFFGQTKEMTKVNKTYEGKIFGMSKRRRAQFPAIVAVVDALIDAVPPIRSVTFCTGGNREGALVMKLPRAIRESNPLGLIGVPLPMSGSTSLGDEAAVVQSVVTTLQMALPPTEALTVFSIGTAPLFARQIWVNSGEDGDANASAALHDVVTRDPSCPGLTHLARAVLGLTLCARWGSSLGPIDQQLRSSLRALLDAADADAAFWADYIGAVAAVMTSVVPAWPRAAKRLEEAIRFQATSDTDGKKQTVDLRVSVNPDAVRGLSLQDLEALFKSVGKSNDGKKGSKKVHVQIQKISKL